MDGFSTATGMHPRYAREWFEQQAVAGFIEADAAAGTFWMTSAQKAVLIDGDALAYTAPLARIAVAAASRLPDLLSAYRNGGGVGWAQFGDDARDAQGDVNRPWFLHALAPALAGVEDLHAALRRPGARIADVGCGHGWSAIALALAYPDAEVRGYDVDEPSVDAARRHAADVPGVSFAVADGATLPADTFDAVFVFEALHDVPRPVELLSAIRRSLRPGGVVVIMDEAVADAFAPSGDEVERIMYGYSLFVCLPDSMSIAGSAATGTVMRPAVLERYAREAGYGDVRVLPIEGFAAFRFYRLSL